MFGLMENLIIEASHEDFFIPRVHFDAKTGILEISGESYLEDTVQFYAPILDWLKHYTESVKTPISLNIRLTYFNTSSSRSILDMLNIIKDYRDAGGDVIITWYYNGEDIEIEEEVEDFIIDTGLDINLVTEKD
jgi:hypothetical protein